MEQGGLIGIVGLDYFGARYYSGAMGRFTSPDKPFADQHPEDPQSWNLYAYGRNNPLKYVDRNGRDADVTVEIDEKKKQGTVTVTANLAVYSEGNLNYRDTAARRGWRAFRQKSPTQRQIPGYGQAPACRSRRHIERRPDGQTEGWWRRLR